MAETNLIKTTDLARVHEIDFVSVFGQSMRSLIEALGITRKFPKQAGAMLKTITASGTLQSGQVAEGEDIPLSKYTTVAVDVGTIPLRKWRKATTAEAILESGYDNAVSMTTERMLRDVQQTVRTSFFNFLATGTGTASGATFQETLAKTWATLRVLFEDDDVTTVFFMNPLDVADYLATAPVTVQTAFGMNYIQSFMGLGTVVFSASVPQGKIYATVQDNLCLYYVPVSGADLGEAFSFTADETGFIGIHEEPDYSNMTAADTVVGGILLLAERLDGVVIGTIGSNP